MKKAISMVLALTMTVLLAACGDKNTAEVKTEEGSTMVYGSGDYTRINPAMDEHGEINVLLFNGLTAHDGDNQVVPGLAESWDYDETTCTYTFHIRDGIRWHDGEPFTAKRMYSLPSKPLWTRTTVRKMLPTTRTWRRSPWWMTRPSPSVWQRPMWPFWSI